MFWLASEDTTYPEETEKDLSSVKKQEKGTQEKG